MSDSLPLLAPPPATDPARARITAAWSRDETDAVNELLVEATLPAVERDLVLARAAELVARVRARADGQSAVESFMRQYDLSSEEGVLLMCVAEALLRIPDKSTADKLIRDKLGEANWKKHLGGSDSVFVNASTWGLMLTGRLVNLADETRRDLGGAMRRLIGRAGEPVIRLAVRQAMRIMGHQFVMGRSIEEALDRSAEKGNAAYRYSYDMLGEAALTRPDAARYLQAYHDAIVALGRRGPFDNVLDAPSISVKLSALHPRYEFTQHARVQAELTPKVLELAQAAMRQGIGMTVDAEEADRLELSLDVTGAVFADPSLAGWNGFGLAVQAYQKRAPFVIDWLAETARTARRRWCVRLVKGAYWDSEIKRAQEGGYTGYPVFTRKPNTDVSYLACAKRLFGAGESVIYPQFATHNAHTIAAIQHYAQGRPFEYQRLHGMGADLYAEVMHSALAPPGSTADLPERAESGAGADPAATNRARASRVGPMTQGNVACRVYAPVGSHEDLLPYLVRRLLENGANTSFVNRIVDEDVSIRDLVADPCETVRTFSSKPHPRIPLPVGIYGELRKNSMGVNLANDDELRTLAEAVNAPHAPWVAQPLVPGATSAEKPRAVTNPADRRETIGESRNADVATIDQALANGVAAQPEWDAAAGREPRRDPRTRRQPARAASRRIHRAVRARSRQDDSRPRSPRCAKRPTCAATTRRWRASCSASPRTCPGRPASRTSCSCAGAACSSASVRGISRSRSSWARSPPDSRRAMR